MEKPIVALVPDYYKRFACTGAACEDTCCSGWSVDIDQNTYRKYEKVADPEISDLFREVLKRNHANPSHGQYATFKMKEMACPLLTEEKLCLLQLKLGEDYLSNLCSTFPRVANIVNGALEKSLTLSCPEAVRLSLLNPNKMEFEEVMEPPNMRHYVRHIIHTAAEKTNELDRYFWELRIFTIKTIQNRHYPLSDRLIILGMFYQKVQECIDEGNYQAIPQLIQAYDALIMEEEVKKSLSGISTSVTIQMQLMKELADFRVATGINTRVRYFECYQEMLQGLQFTAEAAIDEVSDRYQKSYQEYYLPVMQEREYILENYLVNYVFKNVFPHSTSMKVFEEYVMLVVHYSLIKLHLIGMAGYHKESFSIEHVIKLIQSFSKVVEHDSLYLRRIHELLVANGFSSIAYMAILIKN
ncbi:flagellin lysine-N-methylase [Brevibacillus sp. GCM10020057]|uniref:flagellin lysine-N-methylase n=1 Tax=Brevibacillus sp. GCM10020057 TaxID=3317327 RepID=UPI0036421C08